MLGLEWQQHVMERFDKDIAEHEMIVLHDDGLYRHVRFKKPGTMMYHFDLVTWPGHLAYTGDMGDFVFTRVEDMFSFFRSNPDRPSYRISADYWAQKVVAGRDDVEQFSSERFAQEARARIQDWADYALADGECELEEGSTCKEQFEVDDDGKPLLPFVDMCESCQAAVERERFFMAIEDELFRGWYDLSCPEGVYDAIRNYSYNGFDKDGPWVNENFVLDDGDFYGPWNEFTFRFLWCCYAIVWGIEKYDARPKRHWWNWRR